MIIFYQRFNQVDSTNNWESNIKVKITEFIIIDILSI